jgi:hypothetical protein
MICVVLTIDSLFLYKGLLYSCVPCVKRYQQGFPGMIDCNFLWPNTVRVKSERGINWYQRL